MRSIGDGVWQAWDGILCDKSDEEVEEVEEVEEEEVDEREEDVEEPQSTVLLLLSAVVASWFIQPARQTGIWAGPVWALGWQWVS